MSAANSGLGVRSTIESISTGTVTCPPGLVVNVAGIESFGSGPPTTIGEITSGSGGISATGNSTTARETRDVSSDEIVPLPVISPTKTGFTNGNEGNPLSSFTATRDTRDVSRLL